MASVRYMTDSWNTGSSIQAPWETESIPSHSRLLLDALLDHLRYDLVNLPDVVRILYSSARQLQRHAKTEDLPTFRGVVGQLPRCRWNYALSPKRSFATAKLSLQTVREVKSTLGGSINDVVLGACAGGLRRYLMDHGELPDQPLAASIPVSTDGGDTTRKFGNRVASMTTLLHVHISDPLERYEAGRASVVKGRSELEAMGKSTYGALLHYIPPVLASWISRRRYRLKKADRESYTPASNLVISNVPGPKQTLKASDNVVSDLYSIGPLMDGIGLNITVWSYVDNLNFSIMGCRKRMSDISVLAEGIASAFGELQGIAEQARAKTSPSVSV